VVAALVNENGLLCRSRDGNAISIACAEGSRKAGGSEPHAPARR